MERKTLKLLAVISALCLMALQLQAQVTIGSGIEPRRAALLDLKTQQGSASITTVADPDNMTSNKGGLLLPRVSLTDIFKLDPLMTDAEVTAEEAAAPGFKLRLAGLMVYNINDNSTTLYPAVYTWNGMGWVTSQLNTAVSSIVSQPEKFSFYETGAEYGTVKQLKFEVSGPGTWTYQWYQITGSNMHVRIGKPVGEPGTIYPNTTDAETDGSTGEYFTPNAVLKHFTHTYADNNGFYRFYCIAQNDRNEELISDIAEVAVGCGAKTNTGEWLSFMCFNLGATKLTIADQRDQPFSPNAFLHTENPDEQDIYGSLFQWGRIADNHELRASASATAPVTLGDIVNGSLCSAYDSRPYQQIMTSSSWYGRFIYGAENWTPVDQGTADQLWRNGVFLANDPCSHYDSNLTYHEFWYTGADNPTLPINPANPITAACGESNSGWRTPSQEEWGELFRGGTQPGSPATATANTWEWNSANGRGYEIKPDGNITTLFLPASGTRSIVAAENGQFYNQGLEGAYWSVRINGTLSYSLNFDKNNVNPATGSYRANAFALRCIKN
ncbi:fibrobacter succinogenes major paralogous domain-containing protein [Dysgonomonas reticulitermitis]